MLIYGSVVKQLKLMAIPPVLPPWRRNRRSLPYCRRWTLFPEMPDLWKCFLQRTGWAKLWRKKTMPMPIRQTVWNLLFQGFVPMQKFQTNFIWLSRKNNDVTEEWSSKLWWLQWFNWWLHWPCWTMIRGLKTCLALVVILRKIPLVKCQTNRRGVIKNWGRH